MSEPAYPAARVVAPRVYDHFVRHQGTLGDARLESIAPVATIEAAIDAAFWASLRREERYTPRLSLALLAPDEGVQPLVFEEPFRLTSTNLVRISPAVDRPGLHLAVWRVDGELCVWGTVRAIPTSCCVIEVVAPGLLVLKHRPNDRSGKFANVATLEGDETKIVDERASALADDPELVASLLGFGAPMSWLDSVNVLVELAVSMRGHGRGGSLLMVPAGADLWRESIVHPVSYAVRPTFAELADLARGRPDGWDPSAWEAALDRAVAMIAGLTAVDGATIMTDRYELLAFGAKIARRDGSRQVEHVVVTEPIEGAAAAIVRPGQLGGTRHLSAAQFVHDQRNALALVASQDGRFTVFAWSPGEDMVHAHRVETLLL